MNNKYSIHNIKELFLSILPAQIFSYVTSSLSGIVNGLVIGRFLSDLDMVALGFASPVTQLLTVCSTIVAAGARIVCGRYIGKGDKEKINQTFSSSIFLLFIIGTIITCVGLIFSLPIAKIIASGDAVNLTSFYIKGLSLGALPTVLVPCLMTFLQMRNDSNFALLSTVFLAVVNFLLGIISMKYLEADIFTVGLATTISQFLTLLFIIRKFYSDKALPRLTRPNKELYRRILVIGMPSALASLLYAIRNSILNVFAANYHSLDAVQALSILTSSCGPIDAINIGVGQASLMLASVYIGEKDKESLITLFKTTMLYGLILAFSKMLLIFVFGDALISLYDPSESVKRLAIDLYRAYTFCMPLNIITLAISNTYQAFGKITYCNILLLLTAFIFPLSFSFSLFNVIGINSIWHTYWVAEVLILLVIYVVACIKKKRFISKASDLLIIDNELEVGNHLTFSINTIEEVMDISYKVQKYCKEEKIDNYRSYVAGLCLDEIATNIIEHGFSKSHKKNKFIDIYCDVENGDVNIRVKDNAVAFDPHIKINGNDDPTVNIGIKMVSKLAKEMNYQNTFGLNVLTIKI